MIAVSLFLTLCEIKFFFMSDFMLLDSQKSKILQRTNCKRPYMLDAKRVNPVSSPIMINKNMSRRSLKLSEIRAKGKR
jgi:hypothetical protein